MSELAKRDPEIAAVVRKEEERQRRKLVLIASENYASRAVLEAQGSVLTNKYAEGYPGRRYYGSCEWVDEAEQLASGRVKQLFKAEYANVQPHSGSQANAAVYLALLKPGDTVLAMSLAHGGHLTHGSPASFSGKLYKFVHYGVNRETELLDYEEMERLAKEHQPKLIVAGASSYPRSMDFERIRRVADDIGAKVMVDIAHPAGLIAVGIHPTPVPWAHVVTATTQKTLRGPRGGFILAKQELAKGLDSAVFPGTQGGPLMHIIAAKAVCFHEALQPDFAVYQKNLADNAKVLAAELAKLGFRIVTGGTDNHLLLVDLRPVGITGREAEEALDGIGISANRNAIPFDPLPPRQASGLRLGTAATTTRGLGTQEMRQIAVIIHKLLTNPGDERLKGCLAEEVQDICDRFPIPQG
ncbi:MAG: serine hydroxymethyltransferase [Dehalococcoidia bacterium]|nr:serine hydroxymethyltransferase [Dehalococcoidia bacterium]